MAHKPGHKKLKGKAAINEFQKQISPKGMAAAEAAAKKALEKKYPGMFIPKTKTVDDLGSKYPGKELGKIVEKIVKNSKKIARENSRRTEEQKKKPKIYRDPRFDLTD